MHIKVKNFSFLLIGLFLYLLSQVGSTQIIDETVMVPPNDYVYYSVQTYPGQILRVSAGVVTENKTEYTHKVLDLGVGNQYYLDYIKTGNNSDKVYREHEWIDTNSWESIESKINRFETRYVILRNRGNERDLPKNTNISIRIMKPLGYLWIPSSLIILGSLYHIVKKYFI